MIYKPRYIFKMIVPVYGSTSEKSAQARGLTTTELFVRCRSIKLQRNDHHTADVLQVEAEWADSGIDPRFIKHATGILWMGNATGDDGLLDMSESNHRFTGTATRVTRSNRNGTGFSVSMEFHDHTRFFLDNVLVQDGYPNYSMNLLEAWNHICRNTGWSDVHTQDIVSVVEKFYDRIQFRGIASPGPVIGRAVFDRFAKLGKIEANSEKKATSWDIWKKICGEMGLITYIDREWCVVTTTTEHYAVDHNPDPDVAVREQRNSPRLVWGKNIIEVEETSESGMSSKGVCVTSFDARTNTVLEAFYPAPGDERIRIKKGEAKRKDFNRDDLRSGEYDVYEYNTITDTRLLKIQAQVAYEERARQELQGRLKTAEMELDGVDLLDLMVGMSIRVDMDPDDKELLQNRYPTESERMDHLIDLGYSRDGAALIVRNLEAFPNLTPVFHIAEAHFDLDDDSFEIEIKYHNLINMLGHAAEGVQPERDLGELDDVPVTDLGELDEPTDLGEIDEPTDLGEIDEPTRDLGEIDIPERAPPRIGEVVRFR